MKFVKKFEELEHTSDYYAAHGNLEINRRKHAAQDLIFSFNDIRVYFQELIDDGWDVKSSGALQNGSDFITSITRNSKWGAKNGDEFSSGSWGSPEKVVGYKMGVAVQKFKNYEGPCVEFDAHRSIDNTEILTHINKGWNYEEELNDLHELIEIAEQVKGRMENDGFEVFFSKRNEDPKKPNGQGGDNRTIGLYFEIVKCKKV